MHAKERMIRRLSRVADSSQNESIRRRRPAPQGHVPVCVGEEMERFEVRADLLGRPAFLGLLRLSAQEYGYQQSGVLRIPCPVPLFRRILATATSAACSGGEAEALLRSFDELFPGFSDDPS